MLNVLSIDSVANIHPNNISITESNINKTHQTSGDFYKNTSEITPRNQYNTYNQHFIHNNFQNHLPKVKSTKYINGNKSFGLDESMEVMKDMEKEPKM